MGEAVGGKEEIVSSALLELIDDLGEYTYALKAFGALLGSSNLWAFADEGVAMHGEPPNRHSGELRFGLERIIDLFLDRQEKIMESHLAKYKSCDNNLLEEAKAVLKAFQGKDSNASAGVIWRIKGAIRALDTVIERKGDMAAKALELRQDCIKTFINMGGKMEDLHG